MSSNTIHDIWVTFTFRGDRQIVSFAFKFNYIFHTISEKYLILLFPNIKSNFELMYVKLITRLTSRLKTSRSNAGWASCTKRRMWPLKLYKIWRIGKRVQKLERNTILDQSCNWHGTAILLVHYLKNYLRWIPRIIIYLTMLKVRKQQCDWVWYLIQ